MKCPKCHYLSFEPEPRCKNCGYDFSLAETDLSIKSVEEPEGPMVDLDLHRRKSRHQFTTLGSINPVKPVKTVEAESDPEPVRQIATEVASAPVETDKADPLPTEPEPARRPPRRPPAVPTSELPLFVKGMPQAVAVESPAEEPLVKMPPAPRQPLAVRRSGIEPPRPRAKPDRMPAPARRLGPFDRDLLEDLKRIEAQTGTRLPAASNDAVSALKRLAAACVDVVILAGVSAGVLWLTLRQCGLDFGQVGVLPMIPLLAFFLLLDLGYLMLFTVAGGQTVGKMALGLRVIGAFPEEAVSERLTVQQAAYRSLLTVPSVLALGAGFVPALVGQGRAFHDRLAHTRVVNA